MINDVRNALNSIVGSVTILHDAAGAGGIFELYVMTGVARDGSVPRWGQATTARC